MKSTNIQSQFRTPITIQSNPTASSSTSANYSWFSSARAEVAASIDEIRPDEYQCPEECKQLIQHYTQELALNEANLKQHTKQADFHYKQLLENTNKIEQLQANISQLKYEIGTKQDLINHTYTTQVEYYTSLLETHQQAMENLYAEGKWEQAASRQCSLIEVEYQRSEQQHYITKTSNEINQLQAQIEDLTDQINANEDNRTIAKAAYEQHQNYCLEYRSSMNNLKTKLNEYMQHQQWFANRREYYTGLIKTRTEQLVKLATLDQSIANLEQLESNLSR